MGGGRKTKQNKWSPEGATLISHPHASSVPFCSSRSTDNWSIDVTKTIPCSSCSSCSYTHTHTHTHTALMIITAEEEEKQMINPLSILHIPLFVAFFLCWCCYYPCLCFFLCFSSSHLIGRGAFPTWPLRCIDGWTAGWMDGWMDGWMGCTNIPAMDIIYVYLFI